MAMTCTSCGNKSAYRMSFTPAGEKCDKCGPASPFKFSDVFFKGEYFDPMLAHYKKSPNGTLIKSREHKASVMRELGVTECGDKRHGSHY